MMRTINGKIENVFINPVDNKTGKSSVMQSTLVAALEGINGDRHYGTSLRTGGGREKDVYGIPKSVVFSAGKGMVLNWRQWSAVSVEEMLQLSENLMLPDQDPVKLAMLLGANILVSGIGKFSCLPASSILHTSSNVLLKVEAYNIPCIYPGYEIEKVYEGIKASHFPKAAMNLRGLVGTVFKSGDIMPEDNFTVYVQEPTGYFASEA